MAIDYARQPINQPRRADRAMDEAGIRALLRPGAHYRPITDDELAHTTVYRVDIEQWSGKRKQAAPDFPGAFFYGQPPAAREA